MVQRLLICCDARMETRAFHLDERQTKKLSQISSKISQSEDLLSDLDEVLAAVIQLVGLQTGWIFLREDGAASSESLNSFSLAARCNLPSEIGDDIWRGLCACQDLEECNQLGDANQHVACDRFAHMSAAWPELQSHACIPLFSNDDLLGLLNVVTPNGAALNPGILNVLNLVAAHLGTALDRQRLANLSLERLDREQAILLALTGELLSLSRLEDVLDYLVTEVIRLFQADACALLLPDEHSDYLVFRASAGWHSDPVAERRRIPGNHRSISGKVMEEQVPALSSSMANRSDLPELTVEWLDEEKFEGMAIVPLVVDGESIGALVVTTRTSREFSQEEIRFLRILANQAGIAIVNTRLRKEEIQLRSLEEELAIGRRIQRSLLPATSPVLPGWQFSDVYLPAKQVGGDLYDYFVLPYGERRRLGIVIGDVADKGVPAALFMATSRTLIRSAALAGLRAASTLTEANRLIQQDSPSDLFLSAFYGILDAANGKLDFANAGHNPPLWFRQTTGEVEQLQANGIVLCVLDEVSLEERSIDIARGDVLVFYTDGVTEAINANYEEFGLPRLQRAIVDNAENDADQILEAIVEAVDVFTEGVEHADDITLVVAKRL